jgi:hypothetical protein
VKKVISGAGVVTPRQMAESHGPTRTNLETENQISPPPGQSGASKWVEETTTPGSTRTTQVSRANPAPRVPDNAELERVAEEACSQLLGGAVLPTSVGASWADEASAARANLAQELYGCAATARDLSTLKRQLDSTGSAPEAFLARCRDLGTRLTGAIAAAEGALGASSGPTLQPLTELAAGLLAKPSGAPAPAGVRAGTLPDGFSPSSLENLAVITTDVGSDPDDLLALMRVMLDNQPPAPTGFLVVTSAESENRRAGLAVGLKQAFEAAGLKLPPIQVVAGLQGRKVTPRPGLPDLSATGYSLTIPAPPAAGRAELPKLADLASWLPLLERARNVHLLAMGGLAEASVMSSICGDLVGKTRTAVIQYGAPNGKHSTNPANDRVIDTELIGQLTAQPGCASMVVGSNLTAQTGTGYKLSTQLPAALASAPHEKFAVESEGGLRLLTRDEIAPKDHAAAEAQLRLALASCDVAQLRGLFEVTNAPKPMSGGARTDPAWYTDRGLLTEVVVSLWASQYRGTKGHDVGAADLFSALRLQQQGKTLSGAPVWGEPTAAFYLSRDNTTQAVGFHHFLGAWLEAQGGAVPEGFGFDIDPKGILSIDRSIQQARSTWVVDPKKQPNVMTFRGQTYDLKSAAGQLAAARVLLAEGRPLADATMVEQRNAQPISVLIDRISRGETRLVDAVTHAKDAGEALNLVKVAWAEIAARHPAPANGADAEQIQRVAAQRAQLFGVQDVARALYRWVDQPSGPATVVGALPAKLLAGNGQLSVEGPPKGLFTFLFKLHTTLEAPGNHDPQHEYNQSMISADSRRDFAVMSNNAGYGGERAHADRGDDAIGKAWTSSPGADASGNAKPAPRDNKSASMSRLHQFLVIRDRRVSAFNALTFGLPNTWGAETPARQTVEALKGDLELLLRMRQAANEWAAFNEVKQPGFGVHLYPLNSIQSFHLHMWDDAPASRGAAYAENEAKTLRLDDLIALTRGRLEALSGERP